MDYWIAAYKMVSGFPQYYLWERGLSFEIANSRFDALKTKGGYIYLQLWKGASIVREHRINFKGGLE